jgi:DNA-binding LacI/PurR family transcriptional regulator
VQHLAATRHTRIAFISGPQHLKSSIARRDAFKAAMGEIGLSPDLSVVGDHRMEGGMKAFHELHAFANPSHRRSMLERYDRDRRNA